MSDQPFILGVNYWPRKAAMFMWREFDKAAIDEDMAKISDLGLSCVRIFLLWEDFQPTPKSVPVVMLDRLVELLKTADEKNIKVVVTLFTGHLCGMNWLPPWMLLASADLNQYPVFSLGKVRFNRIRNHYAEAEIMEGQIYFLGEVANAVSGHPALFSWDLGNEPSRYLDFLSINAQPQLIPWAEDPFSPTLPSFIGSVVRWLGKCPVMIQEFGLATKSILPGPRDSDPGSEGDRLLVSEEDAALFTENALLHLRRSHLMGAFWKSYGDYHPTIWKRPPLDKSKTERFAGLVRYDGTPKVAASVLKSVPTALGLEEISSEWLDLTHEEYYQDPDQHLKRLYGRFRECCSLA